LAFDARAQAVDDATRAAARDLGKAGVEAYQAGDYVTATEKLEKAYRVLKAPSLGLWSARALVKVNRWVQASERYLEVTRLSISSGDTNVQKQAQADARSELDALDPTIPGVVIVLEGATAAEVTVTLDGTAVPSDLLGERRRVDPGKHRIEARRGEDVATEDFEVASGETKTVPLRLAAAAAGPAQTEPTNARPVEPAEDDRSSKSALPVVGLVTAGVGVVAIGVGTYFGLRAKSLNDDSNAPGKCTEIECHGDGASLREDAITAANLSTGFFIAGGVLAAGGVTLFLVGNSKKKSASAALTPTLSPHTAGMTLHGAF
jgi:hypothetical protein